MFTRRVLRTGGASATASLNVSIRRVLPLAPRPPRLPRPAAQGALRTQTLLEHVPCSAAGNRGGHPPCRGDEPAAGFPPDLPSAAGVKPCGANRGSAVLFLETSRVASRSGRTTQRTPSSWSTRFLTKRSTMASGSCKARSWLTEPVAGFVSIPRAAGAW